MNAHQYLTEIKSRLVASSIVTNFTIIEERDLEDRGYFRARITLSNNDFLEIAEYFALIDGQPKPDRSDISGWTVPSKFSGGAGTMCATSPNCLTSPTMFTSALKTMFNHQKREAFQNF